MCGNAVQKLLCLMTFSWWVMGLAAHSTLAAVPIVDTEHEYVIGESVEYYLDATGKLSLNDVILKKWQTQEKKTPNFGFTDATVWLRFSIENKTGRKLDWMLEVAHPLHDRLDLFQIDKAGFYQEIKTGDLRPFQSRPVEHYNFVFPITFDAGELKHVYLRARSDNSMLFPLTLSSKTVFAE